MLARGATLLLLAATAAAQVGIDAGADAAPDQCTTGEDCKSCGQIDSNQAYKRNKKCAKKANGRAIQKARDDYDAAIKPIAATRDDAITKARTALLDVKKKADYDFNFALAVPKADRLKAINHARHQLNMDKKDAKQKACTPTSANEGGDNQDCKHLTLQEKQQLQQAIAALKKTYHDAKDAADQKYDQQRDAEKKTLDDKMNKAEDTFNAARLAAEHAYLDGIAKPKVSELQAEQDAAGAWLDTKEQLRKDYENCAQCHHGDDDDDETQGQQPAIGLTPAIRAALTGESSGFTPILALAAIGVVAALLFRGRADDSEEAQPFFNKGAGYTSV